MKSIALAHGGGYEMDEKTIRPQNLAKAAIDTEYLIKDVQTDDQELESFLFTLGCYKGEKVTVVSILGSNLVISVKDARYSIDMDLAEAIII